MNHNLNLVENRYSEEELECNIGFFDKIDWVWISFTQNLSELFIEKHSEKVNWEMIFLFQKISEIFIRKHINKINNLDYLMENTNISNEIKESIKTLKEII